MREVAARHPALQLKIGGQPCAPSLAFQLGDDSAPAKALCIRGMLSRGYLFSSQLYVMWPHTEAMATAMLAAWDEVLAELVQVQVQGRLQEEAGPEVVGGGFARLA